MSILGPIAERREILSDGLAVVLAALFAGVTMAVFLAVPVDERRAAEAIMLAVIAAIYIGFALAERNGRNLVIELVFSTAILAMVFQGLWGSKYWLAAGLTAHGIWDLLHDHRHHVLGTREVPRWYPPACLVYDFPMAAFVILAPS